MTNIHSDNLKINDSVKICQKYLCKAKGKHIKKLPTSPRLYLVLIAKGAVLRWNGKDILLTYSNGKNKSVNTKSKN